MARCGWSKMAKGAKYHKHNISHKTLNKPRQLSLWTNLRMKPHGPKVHKKLLRNHY
jgi:hypothetical protein